VTSVLSVPGNPTIADLQVSLGIQHDNPPELSLLLTAPGGNTVALLTNAGSPSFPDLDVTLDQSAAFPAGTFGNVTGQVLQPQPSSRLSWFNGQPAGGTWRLTVVEGAAADGGTLDRWALRVCEPPPGPNCPSGSPPSPIVSFDFESGDAGFTHSGTSDDWALGTPTAAPITTCHGGASCWKTNLAGTYSALSSQDLVSPPIDLTAAIAPIQLSWAMKYQLETATADHAWVEIQNADGTNPTRLWEWRDATMTVSTLSMDEAAGWGVTTADVSAYAGQVARLVFHLDSDGASGLAGLAIDDVSVKGCSLAWCGNGVVDPGEECDLGALNGSFDHCCESNCHFAVRNWPCSGDIHQCASHAYCSGRSAVCPPESPPPTCDDNDPCTEDQCWHIYGCVHVQICGQDGGSGADGGSGGGGNGGCGCASGGALPAALLAIGLLLVGMRRRRVRTASPPLPE
jgi:MYXO-CTERM domain-containing protein